MNQENNKQQNIPKLVHYCWFGTNKKPKIVEECIKSWKKFLPDYEIREWNDSDLKDCNNEYVLEAYKHKKWAFISDYFRLYALYEYGGIYLDSDNEVFKSFDTFLNLDFFSGYENICNIVSPFTAVVGAKKHNHIIKDLLAEYDYLHFEQNDGSIDLYTNTDRVSEYLKRNYGVKPPYNPLEKIYLEENSVIFPDNIFCRYDTKTSYAVHHFTGSWKPKEKIALKKKILETIFSIKNSVNKNHKIITILGWQFKFRYISLNLDYYVQDIISKIKFNNLDVKDKILIVEPNQYHGECLPGYVKYFQDLGYDVDIFVRHEIVHDSPFEGIKNINILSFSSSAMKNVLKSQKIKGYLYLFLSSSAYWEKNVFWDSFINYLGYVPQTKNGLLLVEHNIQSCLEKYNETKYLEEHRLFTLSGFRNSPILNPHYFVELDNIHKKNIKTKFLIIGHWAKSKDLLCKTLEKLYSLGHKDFEIIVIGAKYKVPKIYQANVKMYGRVKFKKMYSIIKDADFILAMLDCSDESHKRYLKDATSGSCQLCLGFNKPLLINEQFAKAYEYDETNSITYKDNDLYSAIERAIQLEEEDYLILQKNIKLKQEKIYKESLENLKEAVKCV